MKNKIKNLIAKIHNWLTVSRVCAWHNAGAGKTLHRAPFHRSTTHGICAACLRGEKRKLKLAAVRPVRGELPDQKMILAGRTLADYFTAQK
jgi:hypothetical protein